MPGPTEPHREHPSTYMVQDRSNEEELTRLLTQDPLLTASMGGVLSEQADPTIFQLVLDVGCGTGGWLIETAKSYPSISFLIGVDISARMIAYARAQAEAQQESQRVQFRMMDALRLLEFPSASFDLINQRFGASYLRTWDWSPLLQEYLRVSKPGGVIRITEFGIITKTSSPAHARLSQLGQDALYRAGHLFAPTPDGLTSQLAGLLQKVGLQNVQTRAYSIEYRAGTPEGQLFIADISHLYRTVVPFLRKWTRIPDDYQTIYQQMLSEMQQPDFVTTFPFITSWGTKSDE
jgi:ubiquinone/menaquinone biosynthesis C-methylase UbiE